MLSIINTKQFELVSCIILWTYFSAFGLYAVATAESDALICFYSLMYPYMVVAMIGSTVYNMFKQFYDRRAEELRNENENVQWGFWLCTLMIILFPTMMSIPMYRVTKPGQKNAWLFILWNITGMLILIQAIIWPYILEDREYSFYICMSISNYILIYTMIYNLLTYFDKKYYSMWFNPIFYLFFLMGNGRLSSSE